MERTTDRQGLTIRIEQLRQARRIHGGMLNLVSAAAGIHLSRAHIPTKALRRKVYHMIYGEKYPPLDESELEKPLDEYRSLNELFTRGVPASLRPLPVNDEQLLSPVDGTIQDVGTLHNQTIMTIKGIPYKLDSLCPETELNPFVSGRFAILFLSPRDCHRVFAPATGRLQQLVHVPGHRLLVHPEHQTPEFPVFTLNERLVLQLDTVLGRCLLVMVAGWGVGHITHPFRLPRRFSPRRVSVTELNPERPVTRGEWLATFELGSTVILIAEQNCSGRPLIQPDQRIRYGQPLFDAADPQPEHVE